MLADLHFLRPWWLLAMIPAAIILFLLIKQKYHHGEWSAVCDPELLPFILQDKPARSRRGSWIAATLAALFCILAGAGPTWERLPSPAFRNDSALVIALDLSKSMDATDIKPNRITRARYKISDILRQRKDGQTALLVYSGDAFTVTPLTTDTGTINSQLEALNTDIMPSAGSNTGIAIEKAADLLHQAGLAQGHILLVTDGADAESISEARKSVGDYRLSVLAVGTPEGAPIPIGGGFLKDKQGNIVVAKLETASLAELASIGHGVYQTITANDDDIKRLSDLFNRPVNQDKIEKTDIRLQQWDDKGPWLLLPLLPWAALQFRKGLLAFLLICLLPFPKEALAFDWQHLWRTQDQQAQQAFQEQRFQQAAEQFNDTNWRAAAQYKAGQYQEAAETLKGAETADAHYNRGNALAKAGQLQESLAEYQQALNLDPGHADAEYNKALVEKELQKQQNQNNQASDQSAQDRKNQEQQSNQSVEHGQNQQQEAQQAQNSEQAGQQPDTSEARQNQTPGQSQDKQPQPEQQTDKPDDARRSSSNLKPAQDPQKDAATETGYSEQDEAKRANEQLLKRIPDEPTGLLKRKFKYQYGQRDPPPHNGPDW
ncbi:vWA domain-containing protein [Methylomonas sp. MgM2]